MVQKTMLWVKRFYRVEPVNRAVARLVRIEQALLAKGSLILVFPRSHGSSAFAERQLFSATMACQAIEPGGAPRMGFIPPLSLRPSLWGDGIPLIRPRDARANLPGQRVCACRVYIVCHKDVGIWASICFVALLFSSCLLIVQSI